MLKRYRSPSIIKKRRKRLMIQGAIAFGVVSFVVGGLAYFAHLNAFEINTIEIKGVSSISEDKIKEVVNDQIAGTYAFLFPKKNILLYPKDGIREKLNSDYKQIEELSITTEGTHMIEVKIKERKPHILWCVNPIQVSDCYYVDKTGYIYSKAPYFSGNTFVKYAGLINGNPVGMQFSTEEKIEEMEKFIKELRKQSLEVVAVQVADNSEYTAYLKDGGTLLFNDEKGFAAVTDSIATVFEQNGIKKEDISKLDYINLRFDKKVFFKLKE